METKRITRKSQNSFHKRHRSEAYTLDIGAGDDYFHELYPNKVTIDVDPKRNPDIVANAHDLPFEDGKFANVLCTEVLEHLHDPRQALSEMKRVLKPGGKLILTTRFIYPIHDAPQDYFRFTKYGLLELLKDWEVQTIEAELGSLETIAALLQRLIFQAKYKANKLTKFVLLLFSKLFLASQKMIAREFGNITQTQQEPNIMATGYHVIAIKKS